MTRIQASLAPVIVVCLLLVVGCAARAEFAYDDDAGSYSLEELTPLASGLETPPYMGRPVSESTEMRHDALVDLRKQGSDQADLADMLTEEFPADTRGVPFWGAKAEVDGRDAWLAAEAWGLKDGNLDNVRLWAFDRATHDVITSVVVD